MIRPVFVGIMLSALACAPSPAPSTQMAGTVATHVVDARDGKSYPVIPIGTQRWIAQNARFATPRSRCYDDEEQRCQRLGRLYDWQEALTACPAGWRLATDDDWKVLERAAGVAPDSLDGIDARGEGAGDQLKPNGNLGFNAELGGWFDPQSGRFRRADTSSALWTATESSPGRAWHRDVGNLRTSVWRSPVPVGFLLSVRCVASE
jgi:uncharacterized protein (TIGR02145 family)